MRRKWKLLILTDNVSWSADYVLTVTRDEKAADLDGWVTLTNNSGVAYKNAKLQLVAGEVHEVQPMMMARKTTGMADMAQVAAAPQFSQENFSEYHLYSLERRTSIQNNESKQISLLTGTGVPVEKSLMVEGQAYYYRNPQGIGNAIPQPVKVYYRFKNDQKSQLGMPLPAGTCACIRRIRRVAFSLSARTGFSTRRKMKREDLHRQCLRRGLRTQADGLQEACEQSIRNGVCDYLAKSQGLRL